MTFSYGSDSKGWVLPILFLVFLSAAVRFYDLGHLSFYYDEAENALVARTYLETGSFSLPSGHPARNGMTYKWMVAQLFDRFGESETLNRVPAAIVGVFTTIALYAMSRIWFSSIVGFMAAFLYAVWPWSATWGRIGRFYNLQQLLFVCIVFFAWRLLDRHLEARDEPIGTLLKRLAFPALMLAGMTLLSMMTSFTTVHSLCFLPFYLLLLWVGHRGPKSQIQRKILVGYLVLGFFILTIAAAGLFFLDSDYVKTIVKNTRSLELIPTYYTDFIRNNFGLGFSMLIVCGLLMAFYRGSPGLLVVSTVIGPWLVHTFAITYYRPRFIYYLFPFLCLAAALPIGWAVERLKRFIEEREYRVSLFGPGPVISFLVLCVLGQSLIKNILISELSTRNILAGRNATFAREVPNFRDAAREVLPIDAGTHVVTTDPVLSSYYLGRSDSVFPFILPSQHPRHYNMLTPGLSPETFLDLISERENPTVLIGTVRKIEGALARPGMEGVRDSLNSCPEIWEIEGARAYRWKPSRVDASEAGP